MPRTQPGRRSAALACVLLITLTTAVTAILPLLETSYAPSTSYFRSIFDQALEAYKDKTGKDLLSHPLFRDITSCASPEAVLAILRSESFHPGLGQPGSSRDTSTEWLAPTVDVLNQVLQIVGAGVGIVSSRE